jgi:hypothetical protein
MPKRLCLSGAGACRLLFVWLVAVSPYGSPIADLDLAADAESPVAGNRLVARLCVDTGGSG